MGILNFIIFEVIKILGWLANYIFEARQERERDEERRKERKNK